MRDDLKNNDVQGTAYEVEHDQSTPAEQYHADLNESFQPIRKVKPRLTNSGKISKQSRVKKAHNSEDTWTKDSEVSFNLVKWLLMAGGGFLAIIVLSLVIFLKPTKAEQEELSNTRVGNVFDKELKEDVETWFYSGSSNAHAKAIELLSNFKTAKDDTSRSKMVRNPDSYLALAKSTTININPLINSKDSQKWFIGQTGGTGYLRLICNDESHMPFRAYFVRDGESLKLDVDATLALSEISPSDGLVALEDSEEKVFRCLISRKSEFYSGSYNDEDHAFYLLRFADESHTMWGYVEAGSELDLQLKGVLDHGSYIMPLKKNVRVTLKVARRSEDSLPKQIDIVALLHKEWITPDKDEHDEK